MKFKVTSINRTGSSLFMGLDSLNDDNRIKITIQHCDGANVTPAHMLDDIVEINVCPLRDQLRLVK